MQQTANNHLNYVHLKGEYMYNKGVKYKKKHFPILLYL